MKIVIEIPHQTPASVNLWTDESFNKECRRQASVGDNVYCVWTAESVKDSFDQIPAELQALFEVGHKEVVEYGNYNTEFEPVADAPSQESFGWEYWIHDLHIGVCFDDVANAEAWVNSWVDKRGHQSLKVKIQFNALKESL